jgi:hypothetical protein
VTCRAGTASAAHRPQIIDARIADRFHDAGIGCTLDVQPLAVARDDLEGGTEGLIEYTNAQTIVRRC